MEYASPWSSRTVWKSRELMFSPSTALSRRKAKRRS